MAYFEIYNELVYDLLQPSLCPKSKKRASLRVCDDGAGNAYVKGRKPPAFGTDLGKDARRDRVMCVSRSQVGQCPQFGRGLQSPAAREQEPERRSHEDEPVLQQEAGTSRLGLDEACLNLEEN